MKLVIVLASCLAISAAAPTDDPADYSDYSDNDEILGVQMEKKGRKPTWEILF